MQSLWSKCSQSITSYNLGIQNYLPFLLGDEGSKVIVVDSKQGVALYVAITVACFPAAAATSCSGIQSPLMAGNVWDDAYSADFRIGGHSAPALALK